MAPSLPKLALILYLPVLVLSNKVTKKQNIASDGAAIGQTVMAYPIDVVYTWLQQPSEAEFRKLESYCGNIPGGMQRFRNMGTFRLSLRMLEKNMPWVRKIFIVTPDGTAPAWLNRNRPEIEVVDEKTLFSRKTDLPVHNSQQVETHLHTIPGLAERFIYFNDDMFASRPLQPSFFFYQCWQAYLQNEKQVRQTNCPATELAFSSFTRQSVGRAYSVSTYYFHGQRHATEVAKYVSKDQCGSLSG